MAEQQHAHRQRESRASMEQTLRDDNARLTVELEEALAKLRDTEVRLEETYATLIRNAQHAEMRIFKLKQR
jgi:hypothetical protein